jgi:presenilin-like A22 family membrane protease
MNTCVVGTMLMSIPNTFLFRFLVINCHRKRMLSIIFSANCASVLRMHLLFLLGGGEFFGVR